jgi:hypothetical protein
MVTAQDLPLAPPLVGQPSDAGLSAFTQLGQGMQPLGFKCSDRSAPSSLHVQLTQRCSSRVKACLWIGAGSSYEGQPLRLGAAKALGGSQC